MAKASPPLAEPLADFAAQFDLRASPAREALLEKAKIHVLDGIGVALAAGTMEDDYAQKLLGMVRGFESAPQCTIIGFRERAAPALAALMNGSMIHGCEYDDIAVERVVHSESFAVPTVLALGERHGLDGWAVLGGWVLATELAIRLACGANDSINHRGFHTTSVFGTLGAAVAAARLLGLSNQGIADALSLAVSFASGTNGGWGYGSGRNKSIQPGWAAMSGIMAAQASASGYECAHVTLDAPTGLYAGHAGAHGWSREPVLDGLGTEWKCFNIAFKMYPAAGLCQAVIDCTKELVYEHDIRPEEVERVEVVVAPRYAFRFTSGRYKDTFRPSSGYTVYGSWPCNVARMILNREVGVQHLRWEAVQEADMLALADRVTCQPGTDDGLTREEEPTTVTIHTTTRGSFARTRRRTLGHPAEVRHPDIVDKFRRNARLVLPEKNVEELVDLIMRLEQLPDLGRITKLLTP
jgi:2-methylcitrate dehydratase PrpD